MEFTCKRMTVLSPYLQAIPRTINLIPTGFLETAEAKKVYSHKRMLNPQNKVE